MKTLRKIFLSICILLLLLPLLNANIKHNQISVITNRNLTELDFDAGVSRSDLIDYVNDRIGFRDKSISFYTKVNDALFDKMVHPTYTYGKNGYVFFKLGEEIVDVEFLDAFCQYLKQIQDYCEAREVPFIYCFNPSKTTVYNEFLPVGYKYSSDFLNELYADLEKYEVNYISNVELLSEKAKTEQVYNVKYDAGHWNDLGQFYGTNHLLSKLSEYFTAVKPHDFEDFNISTKVEMSLPVSEFEINETVPSFVLKDQESVLNITDQYDWVEVNPQYHFKVVFKNENADSSMPNVLFFHGSYYNRSQEFYKSSFNETYAIDNYDNLLNFVYYFNTFKPDCVILETADDATSRKFFDMDTLLELNEVGLE